MTMVKVIENAKHQLWLELFTRKLNQLMTMTQHENNKDEGDYEDDCEPTKARFCTDLAKEKDDYDPTQVIHTHAYNNDCEAEDDCDPTRALYCRY